MLHHCSWFWLVHTPRQSYCMLIAPKQPSQTSGRESDVVQLPRAFRMLQNTQITLLCNSIHSTHLVTCICNFYHVNYFYVKNENIKMALLPDLPTKKICTKYLLFGTSARILSSPWNCRDFLNLIQGVEVFLSETWIHLTTFVHIWYWIHLITFVHFSDTAFVCDNCSLFTHV